ncbi:MAG: MATE family efflux transporter [Pirellulales bacterium]
MRTSVVESPGTVRPMLRLALPALAEQLLGAMVMLVDVWLAGHYLKGAPELAAIGLMAYAVWFLTAMFDFVALGATAMTARFVGAANYRRACHVTNQAILTGTAMAVAAVIVVYLTTRPYVAVMQLDGEAADLAIRYILILVPVLPAIMLQRVGIACLRGAGDMVTVFWLMAIVNVVNVVVSSMLVIGIGPAPKLGWDGLAIGTASAQLTGGLLMLALLVRGHRGLRLRLRWLKPNVNVIVRLLRVGIPGGIDTILLVFCHMWYLSIINQIGDDAAAAHNVAVRLESLAFLPGGAFSLAAMTLAGQFLGAGDPHRAGRSVLMATFAGCGIMLIPTLAFVTVGLPLVSIFLDASQMDIAAVAAKLLMISAISMMPLGLVMILSGAMRGAGDTRWPMIISLVGMLLIRIPVSYLLIRYFEWGVAGAWYAAAIDLSLRCLMVIFRFRHGGWKHVKV